MNKKILIASVFVTLMITVSMTSVMGVSVSHEFVLIKNIQPSIEVIIEVTGNGRNFHITTNIHNKEDEDITILLECMPGGGFEIYNQHEEIVFNSPKVVWPIMWELTLEASQIKEIFNETWKGVDNNCKNLPSGEYLVRGIVFTDDGDIFSESINIFLDKTKIKNILRFLEQFSILRLLFQR